MQLINKPSSTDNVSRYIGSEEATQEEQLQYEQALNLAMTALHDDKTGPAIFQMVTEAESPEQGIAQAVFTLLEKVGQQLKGQLSDSVKVEVAEDLVDEITGLMITGGRLKESQVDDDFAERIVSNLYRENAKFMEMSGKDNFSSIKEDLATANSLGFAPQPQPQGVNAMANGHARATQGLIQPRGGLQNG